MRFSKLAEYWGKLEGISGRNKIIEVLAEVLKKSSQVEVDKVCYLSLGRLGPLYAKAQFNLGEKLIIRAIAVGAGIQEEKVKKRFKKVGDLGEVVGQLVSPRKRIPQKLSVTEVFRRLLNIANEKGEGSVERKLAEVAELLGRLDPVSAKYAVRIPVGKMRLGFSDKTIIDALSFMQRGDKTAKKELEEAYKVRPDIGKIAKVVKRSGISGLGSLKEPQVGIPILMAQAKRMSSAKEILDKIGKCAVEPKIDGFRLQCHYVAGQIAKNKKQIAKSKIQNQDRLYKDSNVEVEQLNNSKVWLITRNLDNVTNMYPDIVEAVKRQIKAKTAIFEGEAVAYNPRTGKYLPFQETVQRKRKYNIEKFAKEVPLKLIVFDCLYLNGRSLLKEPYKKRRKSLQTIQYDFIGNNSKKTIILVDYREVDNEKELEKLFEEAVGGGFEGVMAKRLEAGYQAGARNWNWIKYKRSYSSELADTVDCIVMGYDYGKGKRTKFGIGAFLVGVYDSKNEVFRTVSKIGTGLSDKQWREMKRRIEKGEMRNKPLRYYVSKEVKPDVWVQPEVVVEIEADEITKSPVHTAGLALRFPRLARFRDDKRPEQATSISQLRSMYKTQGRKK